MITNQKTQHYDADYEYQASASLVEDESGAPAQVRFQHEAKWPLGIRFIFILGLSGLLWTGIFILIGMIFF